MKNKKIGIIVQARLSSTRLQRKILKELPLGSGINCLQQVIRRLKLCKNINEIIIATSIDPNDQLIIEIAEEEGVKWFKGDLQDVLSRYYFAAKKNHLDTIVRITSDCPCIDPEVVDEVINLFTEKMVDYCSNIGKRTFPHGLDTEVFSFNALEKSFLEAKSKSDREHVTSYIRFTNSKAFSHVFLELKTSDQRYAPEIRITLDTEDDYIILCAVFDYLFSLNEKFLTKDIVKLFNVHPWLLLINNKIIQKKTSYTYEEEINEAIQLLKLQGLNKAKKYLEKYRQTLNEY